VPCLWHRHIEAGDLGSHSYNAWLVQLIQQRRAPGLWIKHIWNNILFDSMLTGFGSLFGLDWGEKIAVALAVVVFFGAVFAFVAAVSRTVPWTLVPGIAMLAYGWTFQLGLLNYYLSIALAFLALSIFCVTRGWNRLYAVAFAPVILLAHPLGLAWFLGASAYISIAETAPERWRIHLPAAAGLVLVLVHKFTWHPWQRYFHFKAGEEGGSLPYYMINGMDQFVIYSNRYRYLAGGWLLFAVACLFWDVVKRRHEEGYRSRLRLPLELYIVAELGVLLLPDIVYLPRYAAAISLLQQRLGLVSAVLMLAMLGTVRKRAWHAIGFGLIACVFFSYLYRDTGRIDSMETQAERLVSELPYGTRVMATILPPAGTPLYSMIDIVDRACIKRCFSFGNYEPPSRQFRVQALPGNGIVTTSFTDSSDIESGTYVVKSQDLPAYQVYQCSPFTLCIRKLEAGEKNDRFGIWPNAPSSNK